MYTTVKNRIQPVLIQAIILDWSQSKSQVLNLISNVLFSTFHWYVHHSCLVTLVNCNNTFDPKSILPLLGLGDLRANVLYVHLLSWY